MNKYEQRAKELCLTPEHRRAYAALADYIYGGDNKSCPSCGEQLETYENDLIRHARSCKDLISDSNE